MKIKSDYLPALTGVRALAAYMVFIHHYLKYTQDFFGKYVYNFLNEFHVGVTFFFVLSGFLIAYRYYYTKINIKKYLINRVARIYPIYFILTTLTFLYYIYSDYGHIFRDLVLYILNISFTKGLFDQFKFSGIEQGWSLTVEEMFYMSAPFIFYFLKKNRLFLFLLPMLFIAFGFLLTSFFSTHNFLSFMGNNEFMLNYTFFGRCLEFFIGIGLAIIIKRNLIAKRNFSFTYIGAILIIVCIFLISLVKGNYDFGIRHPLGKAINNFLFPLFGIAIFYFGLITERSVISRFFSSKIMVLLGKSSYIFYLIHVGIFVTEINKFTQNIAIIFILINVISIFLYQYVENPLNTYIRNKFNNSPPLTEAAITA